MDNNRIIDLAKLYVETLFSNDYSGHDFKHSLRVYNNALLIAKDEKNCNLFVVSLASLLHDTDDYKLFDTQDNHNARIFLNEQNIDNKTIEQIIEVINGVSFSKNRGNTPKTIEGKIVQDADRLDAIGAIGVARAFEYGGAHGQSLFDSLKHFDDKLLLLINEMNTKEGKRIGQLRHNFLLSFIREINSELNGEK